MYSGKPQHDLRFRYFAHMHNMLMDLYVSYQTINPLKLLILSEEELRNITEQRKAVPFDAQHIVQFILQVSRLSAIVKELVDIINESNMMLLYKRVYANVEEWHVRGIVDWPNTLKNIVAGKPVAQKIIAYTMRSPENLLLRAVVDYTNARLEYLLREFEKIRKKVGSEMLVRAQGELYGLEVLGRTLKSSYSKLNIAVDNSFLKRIPRQIYTTQSLDPIWKLAEEVESTPWRPEWVDHLLDLTYIWYTNNRIEKELERIVDLVINGLIKEPIMINVAFKVYSYKLYEIYNFFIVLRALRELGARIELVKPKTIKATMNGKLIEVMYNQAPEIIKTPIIAIPDTFVKNKEKIIIEAKFSNNPSYLSQAVFKVISYVALFKAKVGVLTYPSISKRKPIEKEDRLIYEKILARKQREITINTGHGEQKILVLHLEPLKNKDDLNVNMIKNIIEKALES